MARPQRSAQRRGHFRARIAELADRVAREHDHFTITRNGRPDVMLISLAEYESMQETLDILSDDETLADLRQSRDDTGLAAILRQDCPVAYVFCPVLFIYVAEFSWWIRGFAVDPGCL